MEFMDGDLKKVIEARRGMRRFRHHSGSFLISRSLKLASSVSFVAVPFCIL